jgi:small conductance mechanosensitive channel
MENYLVMIQEYVSQYGIKILGAVLILIIGLWVAKLITKSFNKMLTKKEVDPTLTKFFTGMVRILLIVFVIIAAIDQAGIETTSFVAVLGRAGWAGGVAMEGSLAHFASGVMLLIF